MNEDSDALAFERARMDQTTAAGVELARMLVSFHHELKKGHLDDGLAADLTNSYFEAMLDNATAVVVDEDEDE